MVYYPAREGVEVKGAVLLAAGGALLLAISLTTPPGEIWRYSIEISGTQTDL
jgi:hypothetical protein